MGVTTISYPHPHVVVFKISQIFLFQFIVTVEGRGGKFDIKNTVLNIGSGKFRNLHAAVKFHI